MSNSRIILPDLPDRPSPAGEGPAEGRRWGKRPRSVSASRVRVLRQNLTRQEARLWVRLRALRAQGLHFRKQVPIDRFVVDFACLSRKLVVEIDGEQHGWDARVAADAFRDGRLAGLGYRVLRFWNHEVDRHMPMVLDTIHHACVTRCAEGPGP